MRENETAYVAGWGFTQRNAAGLKDSQSALPSVLQTAEISLLSPEKCQLRHLKFKVTGDMFCSESTETDICQVCIQMKHLYRKSISFIFGLLVIFAG